MLVAIPWGTGCQIREFLPDPFAGAGGVFLSQYFINAPESPTGSILYVLMPL